ncbi:Putative nuclear matrix constituent protein 1-like protein [Glycine soja]|nr:Putative nuclear matrix constituent protein 1-like protein [Glycine soja]
MGCLIFERKELASKYEQVKASIDSSEFMCKHDSTMTLSALIEARKREESLKKAVGVTEACIETKISAESKVSEAHQLIDEAQKKSTEAEAEAKLLAAASFQAKACGYNGVAGRKLRDVEAREDELKRQIISFKSDNGQKHLTNDNSLDNVGKRQQRRFSFGEPKVILDVPSPAEDVYRVSDFESEIKKHVNRTVPLVWDGCNVSKWKRGRGNFGIGDPLQDTLKDKKLRSEDNQ